MVTLTGGKKLDAALAEIGKKLGKSMTVEIGWPSNAHADDGSFLAMRAAMNEFGHGKTPPRPFFRTMIKSKSPGWPAALVAALKATDNDLAKALAQVGAQIAADLAVAINEMNAPPLSPLTVMLRGMRSKPQYRDLPFGELVKIASARVTAGKTNYGASTKPLVDSGQMIDGIVFMVKDGT